MSIGKNKLNLGELSPETAGLSVLRNNIHYFAVGKPIAPVCRLRMYSGPTLVLVQLFNFLENKHKIIIFDDDVFQYQHAAGFQHFGIMHFVFVGNN